MGTRRTPAAEETSASPVIDTEAVEADDDEEEREREETLEEVELEEEGDGEREAAAVTAAGRAADESGAPGLMAERAGAAKEGAGGGTQRRSRDEEGLPARRISDIVG